jgi:hypothetical protein
VETTARLGNGSGGVRDVPGFPLGKGGIPVLSEIAGTGGEPV